MEIDEKIKQAKEKFLVEYMDHEANLSQYEQEYKSRYWGLCYFGKLNKQLLLWINKILRIE